MTEKDPVVIIGGGFAGISMAHSILNHVQPTPKVILVSASRQFWYKVCCPRMLARPDLISVEHCSPDIEPAFADYPAENFTFVYAYARSVSIEEKTVELELIESGETTQLKYAALVVATGGRSQEVIWSPEGPIDEAKERMGTLHEKLKTAKTVVIAGGGSLGIETAGEIGYDNGKNIDIRLYSGGQQLLGNLRKELGRDAEHYLTKMGVEVIHNIKTTGTTLDEETGKTIVSLDNGETVTADIYLSTTGLKANTDFCPSSCLNEKGFLETDEYLRVKNAPGLYSIGSSASYSHGVIPDILDAVTPLTKVLNHDLSPDTVPEPKPFHRTDKETILIPVGRSKGVGLLYGVKLPSFLVWAIKGRTYFAGSVSYYLNGEKYR
ncbi:Pyridine nucleotide-disulfide oxidoreductase, FAD/NAD(P)-binding domain protein [Ascosphaera apis ARSEF 7405]|uniref:Pyridine nucleotide-disulfide oxidoreductase, FAD/NAD(P)-binding domain protein n=1 Tax=Ascosphaera apis ARSEF 7405 TaxID=392613 RepID=A0A167V8L8_9EURO|nr:Pyridine nucleotide-disulfide oxidoreductase, FAD/NAD(P)-binding domain protein [Ascosphaera apis ARSEF 7405]